MSSILPKRWGKWAGSDLGYVVSSILEDFFDDDDDNRVIIASEEDKPRKTQINIFINKKGNDNEPKNITPSEEDEERDKEIEKLKKKMKKMEKKLAALIKGKKK